MNEINLPYHLIIPSLISIIILRIIIFKRKELFANGKRKWFWISVTVFFAIYLFILVGAIYSDLSLQWTLNKFDLNKDGLFTGKEITPEQQKAMANVISDTGRNFSFVTGLFISGIISLLVFIGGKIVQYRRLRRN